jgi:hypothetical protein
MGMSFGVHSEVIRLRKVHRPGRRHARLTPSNAEEVTTLIHESAAITKLPAIARGGRHPRRRLEGDGGQPGRAGCDRRTRSADRHAHSYDVPPLISET